MIPNIITSIRVILVLPIMLCMIDGSPEKLKLGAWIFLVASFTDFLDGQAARRLKMESQFGSMYDLIADRLMMSPTLIFMLIMGVFDGTRQYFPIGSLIYVIMVVFVDINVIIGIAMFLRLKKSDPTIEFPTPTIIAKANFPFQISVVFFALLLGKDMPLVPAIFMWATMITTPAAYITYMKKGSYVFSRTMDSFKKSSK